MWGFSGSDRVRVDKPKISGVIVFVVDAPPFVLAPVGDECPLHRLLLIVHSSAVHDSMTANHISCDNEGSAVLS